MVVTPSPPALPATAIASVSESVSVVHALHVTGVATTGAPVLTVHCGTAWPVSGRGFCLAKYAICACGSNAVGDGTNRPEVQSDTTPGNCACAAFAAALDGALGVSVVLELGVP